MTGDSDSPARAFRVVQGRGIVIEGERPDDRPAEQEREMVAILSNTDPEPSTPPGSVPTVGVEEEFILVHPQTGTPFLGNTEVAKVGGTLGADLQLELSRCQIETATAPCGHLTDLGREVRRARAVAADAAAQAGARLLAVAVPPAGPTPALDYRRPATG
jgi:carboxylate-amine ligase